ncbi:MAG: two-component system, OmpR family, response regulator MtrA [Chloroflexota bacterium]|jgi:CheY-like chemotaxis protein|nr:two-component system, OmpR family, response regulator MtrA [Chloroflexota bacterium]
MARIVFCDDDPMVRKVLRLAFRSSRHEVFIAADGVEGLALVERLRPDLLCTDVAMPGLTGLELADIMKSRPELAGIPIMLVTASAQRGQIEEALRHGPVECLTKPFDVAYLRERIEYHLSAAAAAA